MTRTQANAYEEVSMSRLILPLALLQCLLLISSCSSTNEAQSKPPELVLTRITAEAGESTNIVAEFRTGSYSGCQATDEATGDSVAITSSYPADAIIVEGVVSATFVQSLISQREIPGVGSLPDFRKVTYRITSGSFGVDSSLVFSPHQEGKWDGKKEGAVHRLKGKLKYFGYEFDSNVNNPLTFRVMQSGYAYLHGSGTVKDTENDKVYEVTDSSTTGKLLEAVGSGDLDKVKKLLTANANVNARQPFGDTALTVACTKGSMEMVDFLISRGADFNETDILLGRVLRSWVQWLKIRRGWRYSY